MTDKKENISGQAGDAYFLPVSIGAAAGWPEAITELLHGLPAGTGRVYPGLWPEKRAEPCTHAWQAHAGQHAGRTGTEN